MQYNLLFWAGAVLALMKGSTWLVQLLIKKKKIGTYIILVFILLACKVHIYTELFSLTIQSAIVKKRKESMSTSDAVSSGK